MNLRPSGYEPDELIFRKFLKTRNLRYHNGLAVFFHDHHVDHGDHDDHNLATFWLQWHECASEKFTLYRATGDPRGVSPKIIRVEYRNTQRGHQPECQRAPVSGLTARVCEGVPDFLESRVMLTR